MAGKLQETHKVLGLAPVDIVAVATSSKIVGAKEGQEIEFDVTFGVITATTVVVTIEECDTIVPGTATAIAFKYQKSAVVGTDTMAAVATATTAGVTFAATDDNKFLRCFVDPAALSAGYPYARATVTPGGTMTVCLVSVMVDVRDRYPQAIPISAVD